MSIYRQLKLNKWYVVSYMAMAALSVFAIYIYMNSTIEDSYNDIKGEIDYRIFENKANFGVRSDSYSIVSYKESKVPTYKEFSERNNLFSNITAYNQMFENTKYCYLATGGWEIILCEKRGDNILVNSITPFAVTVVNKNTEPDYLFRQLYDTETQQDDYNIDINNEAKLNALKRVKSRFHYLSAETFNPKNVNTVNLENKDDISWWDENLANITWFTFNQGISFSLNSKVIKYKITERKVAIIVTYIIIITLALLLDFVILWLLWRFVFKHHNKTLYEYDEDYYDEEYVNSKHEDEEQASANYTSDQIDIDIEALMKKIHPSNFMEPYDAKKVKIANDLYSALLNVQNNETIINIIKAKAQSELNIEINQNNGTDEDE